MSDIEDYPVRQASQMQRYEQQQVQQRQVLALMGIEPWINVDSPTINIASIEMPTRAEPAAFIVLPSVPTHNSPVQEDIHERITTDNMTNPAARHSEVGHLEPLRAEPVTPQPLNKNPQITAVQRHRQQRQILAIMGIEQWVQPTTPTLKMADIKTLSLPESESKLKPALLQPALSPNLTADLTLSTAANSISEANNSHVSHDVTADTAAEALQPCSDNAPTSAIDKELPPLVVEDMACIAEDGALAAALDKKPILEKVAPFDLQGGRYGNWILLVDIHALNHDSQTLWHNITQALSLTCETLSFPICRGEDAPYLANASLAGYIFRLSGMSEALQIAALTALPDGLMHPNLISMPTLSDMLADHQLKQQLWQQLAH